MSRKLIFVLAFMISQHSHASVEISDNLSVSGFGSTSAAKSDNETPLIINRRVTDKWCWDCDTTFGLQLDYFNNAFKASAQMVKRPQDKWKDPELEWAYLGYAYENFELRAGRLRLPVYLASEYYFVGHAYKTARPPEELYNAILGITAYNGINLVWNFELLENYQVSISPFVAFDDKNTLEISDSFHVDVNVEDILGFSSELHGDYFKWKFTYFDAEYDQKFIIKNPAPGIPKLELDQPDRRFELFSLGAEYELNNWTLTAERQLGNVRSTWYASIAYRIDQFTPYVLYGETKTKKTDITPFEGKSGSSSLIGVRYDIRHNLSVNLELQRFKSFEGQRGSFTTTPEKPDADLVTLMFNFVF